MDIEFLQKSVIFRNMEENEIRSALKTLHAAEKKYIKDDIIMVTSKNL